MKIVARLNSEEGGCDYTSHFKKYWIENKRLHPIVKAIEVDIQKTFLEPNIMLFDSEMQLLLKQVGSAIDPGKLQEFILMYNG